MRRLALVLLVACAHTPNLALRPETPAPAGEEVGSFTARDGTQLWRRKWLPTAPQKGVLIIQHGLRDHSDNYDRLARRAAAAGFAVWAADLRGHARSAGPRVAPKPWHVYIDDLDKFISIVRAAEPGQPIFLMGHSMGGAIVALTVIERHRDLAGLILSAPVLNLGVPPLALAGVRMIGALGPSLGVLKLDPNAFSSDPAIGKALVKDPLVEQGAGPARTAAGLADAAADIFDEIDKLTLPILALHGTKDQLTAPSGSRALVELAPSTDKSLRIYDGFAHDLVHEPEGARVEDDILAWLAAHTGGPPVPPPPLYSGKLRGDPAGRVVALQLGGGIVGPSDDLANTGVFELALHFGQRTGLPVGYGALLTLKASGDGLAAAAMPVGISARFGPAAIGLAGGISTVPIPDGYHLAVPVGAFIEVPFGPAHATASAQFDYRLTGDPPRGGPLSADLAEYGLSLRFGSDRRYWPRAYAGVGTYIRGAILDAGTTAYSITLGLSLYGAD